MRTIYMEDAQRTYNHEEDVKRFYVSLGNAEIESNGHKEGKEENIYLVETVRIMQIDVWSYREDK
jgi:hypothetical protein